MCAHEIQRFPRLRVQRFPRFKGDAKKLEDAPIVWNTPRKLSKLQKFEAMIRNGEMPRGYDKLSKKQRKLARLIASGESIHDSCKKMHINEETFYRWRRVNGLFKDYMIRQTIKSSRDLESRLDRQVIRATQVIDEALDNTDPYLRTSVAQNALKGRGKWKSSSQTTSKTEISGHIDQNLKVDNGGLSRNDMKDFVRALTIHMGGVAAGNGKIIDVIEEAEKSGELKALPPSETVGAGTTPA